MKNSVPFFFIFCFIFRFFACFMHCITLQCERKKKER
nr:MAG TPA: hypothetical protein [Caudoviricetes sp.]